MIFKCETKLLPGYVKICMTHSGVALDAYACASITRILAQRTRSRTPFGVRHFKQRYTRQAINLYIEFTYITQ